LEANLCETLITLGFRFDPVNVFLQAAGIERNDDSNLATKELILDAIKGSTEGSRYILLLTKNNNALRIVLEHNPIATKNVQVLYGSSFPGDQVIRQP